MAGDPRLLLLHMQRTAGNQAVGALLRQYRSAQATTARPAPVKVSRVATPSPDLTTHGAELAAAEGQEQEVATGAEGQAVLAGGVPLPPPAEAGGSSGGVGVGTPVQRASAGSATAVQRDGPAPAGASPVAVVGALKFPYKVEIPGDAPLGSLPIKYKGVAIDFEVGWEDATQGQSSKVSVSTPIGGGTKTGTDGNSGGAIIKKTFFDETEYFSQGLAHTLDFNTAAAAHSDVSAQVAGAMGG